MKKLQLEELNRLSIEAYKKTVKIPIVVLLDNIRSGLNTGSFFRSSDAFAIEKIYLCGITPCPPHKEINKTAIGATQSVDWSYSDNARDCIASLKKDGYTILGVEQTDKSQSLMSFLFQKNEKYALVFGNEVNGLSDDTLSELDQSLEIRQFGTKHSLNVSVCAGIVLWKASVDLGISE